MIKQSCVKILLVAGICTGSVNAASAQSWLPGTNENGSVAILNGNKTLSTIALSCLPSGQIEMRVKLAPKVPSPARGKSVHLDLLSYFGSRGEAILPPTGVLREYSGSIDDKLLDTLASKASNASDRSGGDSRMLTLSVSTDNGESWLTSDPVTLSGAQPSIMAVRQDCAKKTGAAPVSLGSDEAELREAIFNGYQIYRYSIDAAPKSIEMMPFSAELQRYIDRATSNGSLDYDPFCQCQDYDENSFNFQIASLEVKAGRGVAQLDVSVFGGQPERIRMDFLKAADGRWTVDDIVDGGGSLKQNAKKARPGSWAMP